MAPELCAYLWSSCDGVHFSAIDINGFEDEFNYGFRSFSGTDYGLFVGTVNPYFGLQVWQGIPNASSMTTRKPKRHAFSPGSPSLAGGGPFNSSSHYYIDASDNGVGSSSSGWDTNTPRTSGAPCQVYIANWTDTSISLVVNAPVNKQSLYQASNASSAFLSPLSDFSAFTFAPPPGPIGCPVMAGDNLTFTVTNPQTGSSFQAPAVKVSAPTGTTLF